MHPRALQEAPQIYQVQRHRNYADEGLKIEGQHIDHEKKAPNENGENHGPPEKQRVERVVFVLVYCALEYPLLLTIFLDYSPPQQAHQKPAADVLHDPEVDR